MTTDERVLVTGGGGFLGGAICRRLVAAGHRVRSLARNAYPALDALGVEQHRGDIADPGAVRAASKGVTTVFHVAARPGVWGRYADNNRPNTLGTLNVIEACRREGVACLVYTSSPSVVFDGRDMAGVDESVPYPVRFHAHYPKTKALAEQAVRRAGRSEMKTVCLRPHLIWGPEDNHLVPRILSRARKLRRVGNGTNRVDTIYIDNAADAHVLAARRLAEDHSLSGNVYFISNDEPIGLWDMVDRILAAGGKPPVQGHFSRPVARSIGALMEAAYRILRLPGEPAMTRFVADELATDHWFDISAAKRDLGYRPEVSIDEGLRRLARWLAERPQQSFSKREILG